MKDKVLFANAGIAKFMALLVTLLTMFASCNFVGGQDARTVVKGINPPPKYERPGEGTTFGGFFKSRIYGLNVLPWDDEWTDNEFGNRLVCLVNNLPRIDVLAQDGWWGMAFQGADDNIKYNVKDIVYVEFDAVSNKAGGFYINIFGKENRGTNPEYKKIFNIQNPGETYHFSSKDSQVPAIAESNPLIYIGGENGDIVSSGATLTITNFAFYDANGNEVVPQLFGAN